MKSRSWTSPSEHERLVVAAFQQRLGGEILSPKRGKALFLGKTPELYNIHLHTGYPKRLPLTRLPTDLVLDQVYFVEQPAGPNKYPDCVAFRLRSQDSVQFVQFLYLEAKQDTKDEFRYTCNSIKGRPRPQKRHVWVVGKHPFLGTALCTKEQFQQNKDEQAYLDSCQHHIRKKRKEGKGHWVDVRASGLRCSVRRRDIDADAQMVEHQLDTFLS